MFFSVWSSGHVYTFFWAWIDTQVAITALCHINVKTSHDHGFPGSIRCDSNVANFLDILSTFWYLDRIDLDTIDRAGTFTFQTADTIIHVNMQSRTDHIIIAVIIANITFWTGPFFFRILQRDIVLLNSEHMYPGDTHARE